MIELVALTVADISDTWVALGFALHDNHTTVGRTRHDFVGTEAGKGIVAWTLQGDGLVGVTSIEGLPTTVVTGVNTQPPKAPVEHANGITSIDHLVLMTPDVERTVSTLEGLGLACRRRRQGQAYGKPMSQAFFWLGDPDGGDADKVVLEVVGSPDVDPQAAQQPARFFGIAYTVANLDATGAFLGELMKAPVDAVQTGRQIATISSKAGATVAIALMTPHQ